MTRRRRFCRVPVLLAAYVLVLGACGSDDDDGGGGATTAVSDTATPTASTEPGTTAATEPDASGTSEPAADADPLAPQPPAEPYTIKMTTPVRVEVFAQPLLADFFGELEKENLTLEVTDTPTSEALALLDAGDTDVHVTSPVAGFFNAVDQGLNVRWAAATNQFGPNSPTGLYLRPDLFDADGSVDPEGLKGARIALGPNGWGDLAAGFFREWLVENGLTTDDIDIQSFNSVDALTQLENGGLDGAVLADPLHQQAIDRNFGTLFRSFPEGSTFNGYFVGPNLLESHREAGEAFFRAIARTTANYLQGDYHADPDVAAAIAEVTGAPLELVNANESLIFDPTLALDPSWANELQETWIAIGGVLGYDEALPVEAWVDTSLIEPLAAT
jgi:NitT/TauT family transport system substrate-binding protein